MYWMFEKLSETNRHVLYAYSTGSRELDGRIQIDKRTQEIILIHACDADAASDYAMEVAARKTWHMIDEGYPNHRQVACG